MADPRTALVQAWIAKAEEDLAVARLLIGEERRLLGAGSITASRQPRSP